MSLRPHQPPRPPHEFDIVAYDGHDKPVLVVEIKRHSDVRQFEQLARDTEAYIAHSRRPAPFFLIANPETIYLYRQSADQRWELAHKFNAKSIFRQYDDTYGRDPIYESYLASLIQVWLNDIADNWRTKNPPGTEVFAENDLLDAIRQGSLALDSPL